jgi:hypothetical protein
LPLVDWIINPAKDTNAIERMTRAIRISINVKPFDLLLKFITAPPLNEFTIE